MQQSTAYDTAYDLELFTQRTPRTRRSIAVAPPVKRRRLAFNLKVIKIAALAVVFLALVCGLLYSQAQATALSGSIAKEESVLVELQSEYTYLTNEMEMRTSLDKVESYATSKLGLVKLDQSQITYVHRGAESKIECADSSLDTLLRGVKKSSMNIMTYIDP